MEIQLCQHGGIWNLMHHAMETGRGARSAVTPLASPPVTTDPLNLGAIGIANGRPATPPNAGDVNVVSSNCLTSPATSTGGGCE